MDTNEFYALIEDFLEERLSDANAARLSDILEKSPEARFFYWEAVSVHGLLEHAMQNTSVIVLSGRALSLAHVRKVCFSWASRGTVGSWLGRLAGWPRHFWGKLINRPKSTRVDL